MKNITYKAACLYKLSLVASLLFVATWFTFDTEEIGEAKEAHTTPLLLSSERITLFDPLTNLSGGMEAACEHPSQDARSETCSADRDMLIRDQARRPIFTGPKDGVHSGSSVPPAQFISNSVPQSEPPVPIQSQAQGNSEQRALLVVHLDERSNPLFVPYSDSLFILPYHSSSQRAKSLIIP